MKKRPSIGELFEVLEMEIHLLKEKADGNENIGNIKAVSLLLEERVDSLYRQLKWKNKSQEKNRDSGNREQDLHVWATLGL